MKRCICINHADIYISEPDTYITSSSGGFGHSFGSSFGGGSSTSIVETNNIMSRLGDGSLSYNIEVYDSNIILSPYLTHPSIDNVSNINFEMNLQNFDDDAMLNYFGSTKTTNITINKSVSLPSIQNGQAIVEKGMIEVISSNLTNGRDYYISGNQIIFLKDIDISIEIEYNVLSSSNYKILQNFTPKIFKINFSGWDELSDEFVSLIIPRAEIKLNTTQLDLFNNEECLSYNIVGRALMLDEHDKPIELIKGNRNG